MMRAFAGGTVPNNYIKLTYPPLAVHEVLPFDDTNPIDTDRARSEATEMARSLCQRHGLKATPRSLLSVWRAVPHLPLSEVGVTNRMVA